MLSTDRALEGRNGDLERVGRPGLNSWQNEMTC